MIDERILINDIQEFDRIKYMSTPRNEMEKYWEYNEALNDVLNLIENHPKVGEWIPCSERLPEKYEEVLVTVNVDGDLCEEVAEYWDLGNYWDFRDEYYSYTEKSFEVIAWMPLPPAWKGEDNESN